MRFAFPNYTINDRGDLIRDVKESRDANSDSPVRFLQVCAVPDAAKQITVVGGSDCYLVEMTDQWRQDFTHRFRAPNGIPDKVRELVDVLRTDLRTLRPVTALDFAVVLDWYKVPDPEIEPMSWTNTEVGALVNKMKYWTSNPAAQNAAGSKIADLMADAITRHPLLRSMPSIATVPGSKADGRSCGERLARGVAARTGKQIVETVAVNGPRLTRKSDEVDDLDDQFRMPQSLTGGVLIIDDVISRGISMRAVGRAARFAGAEMVAGLAAVKTMKG